ncbi:hypothetical protein Ahy_A03g015298 [Arachis hypogaea]|uniref:Uncharacterized protein n=1 Tax=Arachis hypogaea TaxID=3818 RepID=A0A445E086_ARAHY|nr:hypothetical protein Ahy_A03g015298 [Arachis hypogaea]
MLSLMSEWDGKHEVYDIPRVRARYNLTNVKPSPPGHIGPEELRPVIPPLLGEGSGRCSVKPASRIALHSRSQVAWAFAQTTGPNSQLGVGRPTTCPCKPNLAGQKHLFHHLNCPHMGHKLSLHSSANRKPQSEAYKDSPFLISTRCESIVGINLGILDSRKTILNPCRPETYTITQL